MQIDRRVRTRTRIAGRKRTVAVVADRGDQAVTPALDLARPLVIGFGVVGRAVSRALLARGIQPTVVEDRPDDRGRADAAGLGITLVEAPGVEALARAVAGATVVLPSPGVPDRHPVFGLAASTAVPVASEFDLARIWDDRPLVAITGTNGKTTVTLMVTDALQRSGRSAAAVGNTEIPLVTALDDASVEVFVVEASSFRLGHSQRFSPTVAAWLNFAPDHLDAHASLAAYEAAKASIWAHLGAEATVVANADDPVVMAHVPPERRVVTFSMSRPDADWRLVDGHLVGPDGPLVAIDRLLRAQPHDLANGLAVAAIALEAGATPGAVVEVIADFAGLPHRLELVGERDGVRWFNDSKATVPQATEAAVGGFASVILLAGGRNKGLSLAGLAATVPPVRHVVALGDAADEVSSVFEGRVPVSRAGSMTEAVAAARSVATPGDVVLLSPGCTSFDWYRNYTERGDDFRALVEAEVLGR